MMLSLKPGYNSGSFLYSQPRKAAIYVLRKYLLIAYCGSMYWAKTVNMMSTFPHIHEVHRLKAEKEVVN